MAVLQEFKCPCCDGGIEFDSRSQKMKCPFCDTEFDVETLVSYQKDLQEAADDDMQWDVAAGQEWTEDETTGMRTYVCETCAGEIVGDANLGATACPFCGNPVVMKGQFAGDLKPDLVIPFKLDKKAAKEALRRHYNGKRLLPKVFKDENRIDEVKGVYVPFWLFEADANAQIRYRATRIRSWSDSNYDYTETQYYSVTRGGSLGFDWVPVDGSSKMADDLMESIEPFDLSGAVDFQTAYLSGYLADKYDVSAEESVERANARVRNTTENAFAATVRGYTTVTPVSTNIQLRNGKAKYALYPVWLLNTNWNGKKYTFAMNGQTGKLVGDLPLDKVAYRKWLFGLTGILTAVGFGLSYLLWLL
jgi:DNA-directed RNA polymerase subunit RPC12/RpoP